MSSVGYFCKLRELNGVAMAFPSSGIESVWRNNIDEVSSLLGKYHKDKFMIW
jgi:hypothetical protein